MFYKPISVREAVQNINETWFLPAIQRPYDWGERNKKENFIYKLFDSLLRRYPIGTLIIWETKKPIPFRDFMKEYDSEKLEKIKDEGLWNNPNKHLVYDGQQRLQSLYSCLRYTFHEKVLCYDLLFNPDQNKEAAGFQFFKKNEKLEPRYIKLNELYSCNKNNEAEFEENLLAKFGENSTKDEKLLVKKNFKNLWNIFVEEEIKLLSYYPLHVDLTEPEVLDIFKRINTTGMELTKSEILFSDVKSIKYDFEENIWSSCSEIKKRTNGFSISPDEILRILFLIIKGGIRVDPERVSKEELEKFVKVWVNLESPLFSFFHDFIYKEFRINHEKIINLKLPLIPLIVYFYYMQTKHKIKFKDFSQKTIKNMKKYFIISQLNYWDISSYTDNFHEFIKTQLEKGKNKSDLNFPLEKFISYVKKRKDKKRDYELEPSKFEDKYLRWFILKILIPNKEYLYTTDPDERFNPEIDHIFPETPKLENYPKTYFKWVSTIWNLQPVKGEINGSKSNTPPKEFFTKYPKYLEEYDFLPNNNPKTKIWSDRNAKKFILKRKQNMLRFARKEYEIRIS